MRYKLTFGAGFAAGYVLGAKAGTERYQQIENAWRRFLDTPSVQQAAGVVGAQAGQVIHQAKETVGGKVSSTLGRSRADGSSVGHMTPTPGTAGAATPPPAYPVTDLT